MPEVKPFRGVRYADTDNLSRLVCPPYDVIDASEQHRLHELSPANAVHLELSRAHDDRATRNREVARTFWSWMEDGTLTRDEGDCLYVYRQDFLAADGRRCRVVGVVGALTLEPFGGADGVLPHERTMPGPIEERLALMHALPVNISPIYAIYRGGGGLTPYLESLEHRPPLARFADDRQTLHRLWRIEGNGETAMLSDALRPGPLVIADGHHRYETALAYSETQPGSGEHSAVLCFCVDADAEDLVVLPYHRALRASGGPRLLERLAERYPTKRLEPAEAEAALEASDADHAFLWHLRGTDALVEVSDRDVVERVGRRHPAWRDLDVVALHEAVLPEVLGGAPGDLRFSKDAREIRRLVDEDGFDAGVMLRPIDAAQVVEVARSGERMPQKASYFWPKALTGLVFRTLTRPPRAS
ncbi:MAG: DUF1015 family protein [Actinomycetota bacterium]